MKVPTRYINTYAQQSVKDDPLRVFVEGSGDAYIKALDAISLAIEGVDEETAQRLCISIRGAWDRTGLTYTPSWSPLDFRTAQMMVGLGIDPLVALWVASLRLGVMPVFAEPVFTNGDNDGPLNDKATFTARIDSQEQVHPGGRRTPKFDGTVCVLSDTIMWNQDGDLRVPVLPCTMVAGMIGRPLTALFTHPLINDLGLTITEATCDGDQTVVRTSHVSRGATMGELMAMGPYGCR